MSSAAPGTAPPRDRSQFQTRRASSGPAAVARDDLPPPTDPEQTRRQRASSGAVMYVAAQLRHLIESEHGWLGPSASPPRPWLSPARDQ